MSDATTTAAAATNGPSAPGLGQSLACAETGTYRVHSGASTALLGVSADAATAAAAARAL